MTKREVSYFIEGIAAAVAAPNPKLLTGLYVLLALKFGIASSDIAAIRQEIDDYVDEIERLEEDAS